MSINRFARHVEYSYDEGESVLCFEPDPTKARVLYESRILQRDVGRNSQGRLRPEYKIHFQGWSRSWDRNVSERLLLADTPSNRKLMRKLHEVAKALRKNRRKKHIAILNILRHKGIERLESPIGSEAEDQEESEGEEEENEEEEEAESEDRRLGRRKRDFEEEAEEEFKPSTVYKPKKRKKKRLKSPSPALATRASSKTCPRVLRGTSVIGTRSSAYHHRDFPRRIDHSHRHSHRFAEMPVLTKRGGQRGRPRKSAPPIASSPSVSTGSRGDEIGTRPRGGGAGGGGDGGCGVDDEDIRESTSTSSVLTGVDFDDDDDDPVILDDDDSSSGGMFGSTGHPPGAGGGGGGGGEEEDEGEEEEELVSPDDGLEPPISIPVPPVSIPLSLAHALTDAGTKIQLGDELVRLPCEPKLSVVAILEEYVHHFTFNLLSNPKWNRSDNYRNLNSSGYGSGSEVSHLSSSGGAGCVQVERGKPGGALPKVAPACSVNLCKEVVDGIRIMFDTYLGPILLYKPEVQQFKKLATYYKPVLPKKVLFPGPVIMPSRLRSQSRVSGITGVAAAGGAANAEGGADVLGAATSSSAGIEAEVTNEATSSKSLDGFMSDGESTHSGIKTEREDKLKRDLNENDDEGEGEEEDEEEEDAGLSTTSSNPPPKIEPSEGDDKENDASFVGGGGDGEDEMTAAERLSRSLRSDGDGSSNDGGSTEAGSSSARVGHLGRAYLASSRDRLSDSLIDAIENWRLVSQETIQKFPNTPSLLYGAHHFLRLFVHLPKLLSFLTDINAVKMNAILFHVEGILNYIDDNAEFFLAEDFANSALVVEELIANCNRNKLH